MRNFQSTGAFKALVTIVIAILMVMVISATTGISTIGNIFGYVMTPVLQVSSGIKGGTKPGYDELFKRNEELQEQVDNLTRQLVDYNKLKDENDKYRKMLSMKLQNAGIKAIPANVIARSPLEKYYGFTIDEGSLMGVKVNDVVLTQSGLVGRVDQVSMTYATVTTVFDPKMYVGALDSGSKDNGIISSDIEFRDKGLLKMIYIPAQNNVKKGDIIITSGLGGIYPKDQIIGTVIEVSPEEHDVTYYAVIKPAADIANATDVIVITYFNGQGEIAQGVTESSQQGEASQSSAAENSVGEASAASETE